MVLRVNTDIVAGIIGLVFAAVLWLPREEMSRLSIMFPRAIVLITVLLGIALIVKGVFKPGDREVEIEGSVKRLFLTILGLIAWWYAIGKLGFLVATSIAFFGFTWFLASVEGRVSLRRLLMWIPIMAVLIGVFYLAFTEVLSVRLPTGTWF